MTDVLSLLPVDRTQLEEVLEQVSGTRWEDADVDIIARFKDPWRVPAHLLNFLAHERSVDIWDENWPEMKKRAVIASAPNDHRKKGTLAGIRRYLEIANAEIVQVVRRPQGFAVSRNLTKEEQEEWLEKHPKVRITFFQGTGTKKPRSGVFVGRAAVGHDALKLDEGRALYGRKAYLQQNGQEIPLDTFDVTITEVGKAAKVYTRFVIPGVSNKGSVVGRMAVGRHFVGSAGKNPQVYTFGYDTTYLHRESQLALKGLPVGFAPRDIRRLRESETGVAGKRLFVGKTPIGFNAIGRDRGDYLLADVIYLVDPTIDVPRVSARSFIGYSRISMPAHQADILIDWKKKVDRRRTFIIGHAGIGRLPVNALDTSRRDFLLEAIRSSKRLSDKIRVSFQPTRDRTWSIGAPLNGTIRIGDRAPNRL